MDYFVGQLQIVLPVLGINAFRTRALVPSVTEPVTVEESPVFRLTVRSRGIDATARQIDGEFTLLPGSKVTAAWQGEGRTRAVQRHYEAHATRFQGYVTDGSIVVEGGNGVVTRPIVFTSPSAAGAVVTGRSCNGRKAWLTDTGVTFGAWEDRDVDFAPPGESAG